MNPEMARVEVAAALASAVRLGVLRFDDVSVRPTTGEDLRTEIPSAAMEDIERVANARMPLVRAMYRQFGMDPTKTRPSSEALLRRVRRRRLWPQINTLVDLCNRCSLETQLPYGLYDVDRSSGLSICDSADAEPNTPGSGSRPCTSKGNRCSLTSAVRSETRRPIPRAP